MTGRSNGRRKLGSTGGDADVWRPVVALKPRNEGCLHAASGTDGGRSCSLCLALPAGYRASTPDAPIEREPATASERRSAAQRARQSRIRAAKESA